MRTSDVLDNKHIKLRLVEIKYQQIATTSNTVIQVTILNKFSHACTLIDTVADVCNRYMYGVEAPACNTKLKFVIVLLLIGIMTLFSGMLIDGFVGGMVRIGATMFTEVGTIAVFVAVNIFEGVALVSYTFALLSYAFAL